MKLVTKDIETARSEIVDVIKCIEASDLLAIWVNDVQFLIHNRFSPSGQKILIKSGKEISRCDSREESWVACTETKVIVILLSDEKNDAEQTLSCLPPPDEIIQEFFGKNLELGVKWQLYFVPSWQLTKIVDLLNYYLGNIFLSGFPVWVGVGK